MKDRLKLSLEESWSSPPYYFYTGSSGSKIFTEAIEAWLNEEHEKYIKNIRKNIDNGKITIL